MKNRIFLLPFILFFAINLFAQDSTHTSLKKSAFAIQFGVSGLFEFSSFQGGTLSLKYHITDYSSIRFGFGIESKFDTESTIHNGIEKDKSNYYSIKLYSQIIRNMKPNNNISLYFGGGPHYERVYRESSLYDSKDNNWIFGLNCLLGVEWFFMKNMSLHGEYGILFYYNSNNKTTSNGNTSLTKSFNITNSYMFKFGLSIYI